MLSSSCSFPCLVDRSIPGSSCVEPFRTLKGPTPQVTTLGQVWSPSIIIIVTILCFRHTQVSPSHLFLGNSSAPALLRRSLQQGECIYRTRCPPTHHNDNITKLLVPSRYWLLESIDGVQCFDISAIRKLHSYRFRGYSIRTRLLDVQCSKVPSSRARNNDDGGLNDSKKATPWRRVKPLATRRALDQFLNEECLDRIHVRWRFFILETSLLSKIVQFSLYGLAPFVRTRYG